MRRMDEKGVSPVIGVILMVAITVILAAVIASFVFGMGSTVKPTKVPGFSVTRVNSTYVDVMLTSLGGATTIENCYYRIGSGTPQQILSGNAWNVGQVVSIPASGGSHLVINCSVDGLNQVVLDTTV